MKRLAIGALVVVWLAWMAGLVRAQGAPPWPRQAAKIILTSPESKRLGVRSVECFPYTGRRVACVLRFSRPIRGHRCFAAVFVVEPRVMFDSTHAEWCDAAGGGRTPPSS